MIKILSIGNSFSQDTTAFVEMLSPELYVRNLYIGGWSLEGHCEMARTDQPAYAWQHVGTRERKQLITMREGLQREKWDYITVQQQSGLSGVAASFEPYLDELIAYVRRFSDAEIVFHRTWAYETGSTNPGFANYAHNRFVMWNAIRDVSDALCAARGLRILPVGDLIAALREHPLFDVTREGISLCRDGYHLNLGYGRLAGASVWVRFFTGKTPEFLTRPDLSDGCVLIREELEKLIP